MPELTIPEDAYVNVEQADNYHRLRSSFDSWNELSVEEKARRLVSASDFLDFTYPFSGEKANPEQGREFQEKGVMVNLSRSRKRYILRFVNWHYRLT